MPHTALTGPASAGCPRINGVDVTLVERPQLPRVQACSLASQLFEV
ncbi:hypothetical protein AB0I30_29810 [Nocardia tengchongensis]